MRNIIRNLNFLIGFLILGGEVYSQMLIPRNIWGYPKLTASASMQLWGHRLFNNPLGLAQSFVLYEYLDGTKQLQSSLSFFSDDLSHDVVYTESMRDWIRRYGSFGTGLGQFKWPLRIAVQHTLDWDAVNHIAGRFYYLYVIDNINDRISRIRYDRLTESMTYVNAIPENGPDHFTAEDMDINNGGDFWNGSNDSLWIACSDRAIRKFSLDGTFSHKVTSFSTPGSTIGDFWQPSGIVCGRSPYYRFANTYHLYVIDRRPTGDRILWLIEHTPVTGLMWWQGTWDAPPSAFLSSIETDGFGQVWVTDLANGKVYKFNYKLDFLSEYGSSGTGPGQFNSPISISNPKEGLYSEIDPLGDSGRSVAVGNISIIEKWDDNSGSQSFDIGTDIVNFQTSDFLKATHYISYQLVDPSWMDLRIHNMGDTLIRKLIDSTDLIVQTTETISQTYWTGYNDSGQRACSGNYKIKLSATSLYRNYYTGLPVNTVAKEDTVFHIFHGDADNTCDITSADVVYMINYVYKAGPEPIPSMEAGDANCNGAVSSGDVVYLINYVYKNGPAPPC